MENYNKDLEMDPTKQQTGTDPLQEWREDKSGPSGASHKDLEGHSPDNEEQDRVRDNLPERNKYISEEDLPDEQYFEEILSETDIADEVEDAIDDRSWVERYGLDGEQSSENKKATSLEYSIGEFDLMEACSKFKARTALPEKFIKQRPMFLKRKDGSGIEMTDEQVLEQVQAYNDCKKNNKWQDYKRDEIDFMRRCSAWNYYNQKINSISKNPPTMADGSPISSEEIEQLALQYNEFRTKDPKEFAQLKVEKKEWAQANFQWAPEYYKDTKQYVSYTTNTGPNGKKEEIKYISKTKPAMNSGEFCYTINGSYDDRNRNFHIKFVNLRYPTDRNIQIANEKEVLKDQMIENEA